jgi:hypothetical protein
MASITIVPADLCIGLVCGAGEDDVAFDVSDIYKAWKDWFVLSDNSKYPQAMDSGGGDPLGGGESLGRAYFLKVGNGWRICPYTTELSVRIVLNGNLFADPATSPIFDYDDVAPGGHTHIEMRTSTLPSIMETGVSGLTSGEAADLATIAAVQTLVDEIHRIHGLKSGQPMTVTPTTRVAGSISQTISGDGVTTTTVTRT